jgi:hypothetical protein
VGDTMKNITAVVGDTLALGKAFAAVQQYLVQFQTTQRWEPIEAALFQVLLRFSRLCLP